MRFQTVAHKIADMKLRLEQAHLLLYQSCWSLDQEEDYVMNTTLSKLAVSEASIQSSLAALHLHGGGGFRTDCEMESMLRDAVPSTLFSGTSEMLRDLIA